MASGAPVIVSRGCALADEVSRRKGGAVVGYGDVAALSAALFATLSDPKAARERAARARAWVLATYGWERIVTQMEAFYAACTEAA